MAAAISLSAMDGCENREEPSAVHARTSSLGQSMNLGEWIFCGKSQTRKNKNKQPLVWSKKCHKNIEPLHWLRICSRVLGNLRRRPVLDHDVDAVEGILELRSNRILQNEDHRVVRPALL